MDRLPLGHAFGQRYELPVPLELFVVGGALVVLLSFALVVRREVAGAGGGSGVEEPVPPRPHRVGGPLAVLVLALLVYAGMTGAQLKGSNIVPVWMWIYVWVAFPLTVGLLGDWTRPVNPFAAIARAAAAPGVRRVVLGTERPLTWPPSWGCWPAVLGYLMLVLAELVFNNQGAVDPRPTATGLLLYALASAVGGLVFGERAWCERGEVFSLLFATWGRLGWFRFGAPGRRGFAGGLDGSMEPTASRMAFIGLLLVSVSVDGLLATPQWARFAGAVLDDPRPGTGGHDLLATAALAVVSGAMVLGFGAFAVASARAGGRREGPVTALAGLLPSLLPIAYGYLLAHNAQYLLINGQAILPLLGNPTGRLDQPWLPYPFDGGWVPDLGILPSSRLWYVQLVVIVLAHVVAVVLAHRHLGRAAADHRLALRSEWPWLVAMVGYTMLSLWLLAQPVIQE